MHSTFGSLILRVVYGIKVSSPHDEWIALAEEGQKIVDDAYTPGRYLVEVLPILRHVPLWMPGARFKRSAAAISELPAYVTRKRRWKVVRRLLLWETLARLTSIGGKAVAMDTADDRTTRYRTR